MDYIVIVISLVLSVISLYLILKDINTNKEKYTLKSGVPNKKTVYLYSALSVIFTSAISFGLAYYNDYFSLYYKMKIILILNILWATAFIDIKSYRIPNIFIIYTLIARGVILIFELLSFSPELKIILIGEVISALALLIASLLCRLTVKDSIGFGDIKLFIVMGLTLGMTNIWESMFLSMIFIFIMALYVLITKSKSRKDSIPFAPAIALGTYLSIILSLL